MDHLPYPSHLGIPPVVVPYLTKFEFDHLDFATFPERHGFSLDGGLELDRQSDDIAAFAQAWLYFGLIEVFIGQPFDKTTFIRQGNTSPQVLDSTLLHNLLLEAKKRFGKHLTKKKHSVLLLVRTALQDSARAISYFDELQHDDSVLPAVVLSVKLLIVHLTEFFNATLASLVAIKTFSIKRISQQESCRRPVARRGQQALLSCLDRLLLERMNLAGWCLHQTTELLCSRDYCTIYYLSGVPRHETGSISHTRCTEMQCLGYNTNDSAYRVRHLQSECQCDFVYAPFNQIARIVQSGGIPLINLGDISDETCELKVVECSPHSLYTAISHVWVDGLGNPFANALPGCQLKRLRRQIQALSERGRFPALAKRVDRLSGPQSLLVWIDTLCIPVSPSLDYTALRLKAVNRMALIYTGARQVLVIDEELSRVDERFEPPELIGARIFTSKWNTRCWTLQEGALARDCFFQFKHAAIAAHTIKKSYRKERSRWRADYGTYAFVQSHVRQALLLKACNAAQTDLNMTSNALGKGATKTRSEKFHATWNDLCRRSTTKADDLHVILANLTEFSASQIMSFNTPVERTDLMLSCIDGLPMDILYNEYPRPRAGLDSANRWIPSIPCSEPLIEGHQLCRTEEGLVLRYDAAGSMPDMYLIDAGVVPARFCFSCMRADKVVWYWIECKQAADDKLPRHENQIACLVMSPQAKRGARLVLNEQASSQSNKLFTRYDCPFTYAIRDDGNIAGVPWMTSHKVCPKMSVVIEYNIDTEARDRLIRRGTNFNLGTLGGIIFQDIAVVLSIWGIEIAFYRLYIRSHPKASYWFAPTGLFVMCVAAQIIALVAYFIPVRRWYRARAYAAWKATFEEDWKGTVPSFWERWGRRSHELSYEMRRRRMAPEEAGRDV